MQAEDETTFLVPPKLSDQESGNKNMSPSPLVGSDMDKRAATQMQKKMSQSMDDIRIEMQGLKAKCERLNMIVTPLMAITDLSLAKKRLD